MTHEPQAWTPGPAGSPRARAGLGGRAAVGAVAALVGVIAWVASAIMWGILIRQGPVMVPRGFPGLAPDLGLARTPMPWVGLLVFAVIIVLVVMSATSRGRARSRAAAFFAGWFAAGFAGSIGSLVSALGLLTDGLGDSYATTMIATSFSGGAYWGITAGWLVGIVAAIGTAILRDGRPAVAPGPTAPAPEAAPPSSSAERADPPAPAPEPPSAPS